METVMQLAPSSVRRAIYLLMASVALIILSAAALWIGLLTFPDGTKPSAADMATDLLTLSLLSFIAWKVAQRRNWARWFLAVLVLLGTASIVASILLVPELWQSMSWVFGGITIIQAVLQLSALILLFSEASNSWFKSEGQLSNNSLKPDDPDGPPA